MMFFSMPIAFSNVYVIKTPTYYMKFDVSTVIKHMTTTESYINVTTNLVNTPLN